MATVSPSLSDRLGLFSIELKSKNAGSREQAAVQLRDYVITSIAELSPDAAAKMWDEIFGKVVFELVHSNHSHEKLGGVTAIDHLLDIEPDETIESKRNLYRFLNHVKQLLPNSDIHVMVAASKTYGRIAEVGGVAFAERVMDFEVQRALDLSQSDKIESAKYAGVLILKELARNSPVHFFAHINTVFEKILVPLRDARVLVREGAAELLATCLDIVGQRDRGERAGRAIYAKVLADAQAGLKAASPDTVHGSLLTYRELFLHAGMFMRETFVDTAETILRFKSHRESLVRRMVITLVPTLAVYDTQTFSEHFLHKSMGHLLTQLTKPNERAISFVAIGHVATAVGSEMKPFLDSILANIKEGLQSRGKKNAPMVEEPIFQCIGMLATSVGPNLTKLLHDQLDLMFACGLTEPLRQALVAIARHIPPLLRTIQDRLLDMLSLILSGQNYKPLGAPLPVVRMELPSITRDASTSQTNAPSKSPELITLALTTLGSFDFSGHVLNEFVRACGLPYLEDDDPDVRQAAALTCCRLFVRDPICYQASNQAIDIISDVLEKLLTVGIADPEARIRQTVLSSLDERFDKHLAQADNVRSLFIALNDEVFTIRVTAIGIIGRLAVHNPAFVMPPLRKALIQLLTELEFSTVLRSREESARLLTLLVSATQRLIKPYAVPMLRVLIPKAKDGNAVVAANVIHCLGELSNVGGEDIIDYVPTIMELLLSTLQEPPVATKRDAALHTLGQICSNTAYVVQPLIDYPIIFSIFSKILHTETNPNVRRETIKVMGTLGALDPYARLPKSAEDIAKEHSAAVAKAYAVSFPLTPSSATDDYYQSVVISALLKILADDALRTHHYDVIEAVMIIFKTQGLKCVTYLPQIIPAFSTVARALGARVQDFYLQQLTVLVDIIKSHVRNYMEEILKLVDDLWSSQLLQLPIIALVESLARALDAEFRPFLSKILPKILSVFDSDTGEKKQQTQQKVFHAMLAFGANIEEYMHLIIPILIKTIERGESTSLRKTAVQTIDGLSRRVNFSDHSSRIIHPLVRVLPKANTELRQAIMDTLCALVFQLGSDFAIFVPMVKKCLVVNRIQHTKYDNLVSKLLNGERLPQEYGAVEPWGSSQAADFAPSEPTKLTVNQQHLKQAWDVSHVSTRQDWLEWFRRLALELMKESTAHSLRACMKLVDVYQPLARELFNAAFLSCWTELYEQYQEDLVRSIEIALSHPHVPVELINILLSLAEFMEHDDKTLPIENRTLGEVAMQYNAFAKGLHYKELEFFGENSASIVEALININTKLQQHDAAWGTLTIAREQYNVSQHELWYEKLGRWQEALAAYEQKEIEDPGSREVALGKMRCLHALGEWDTLNKKVDQSWVNANHEERREIAPLAAAAAWSLNLWDAMDDYIAVMPPDLPDRAFYRAILSVHRNQFSKALLQITKARDLLDPELTSLVGESYVRAYGIMTRMQMLSELEEIISYKQHHDDPERQATMRKTWMKRLQGCQPDVEVWQRILQVRTLVLSPDEDTSMWIKFANLCRKNDRMVLTGKTLNSLLGPLGHQDRNLRAPPAVIYAHLKYLWANGSREDSLEFLRTFANNLARDIGFDAGRNQRLAPDMKTLNEFNHLLARCYLKQGQWESALKESWNETNIQEIISAYYKATQFDPNYYKAWHTWAFANFEIIGFLESQQENRVDDVPIETLLIHSVSAIKGFFKSIALRSDHSLQNTLRLLTLWFKFGHQEDVSVAMSEGFDTVSIDTWLDVIPQIIARIQTPSVHIRRTINALLTDVGKKHPQALIYPLTVASKSSSESRKSAASLIMDRLREHSAAMVEQALVVSHELIRVAILWHEMWHEGLEEASRLYFTEKNPEGMITVLEPLHQLLEQGPTTTRETSFAQVFGRDLGEAREACQRYRMYGDTSDLDKAWDIYYGVFRKVEKQLPQLMTLDLQYVSPELLKAKDLELAVPGTYQSGRPVIKIASFAPKLSVITSKQRPRKLSLKGSNGQDYQYILKGHEDLRQDERVMQLFGLVNTLLAVDTDSFKRHLHIQRYSVIPLAPNAGLIGWVQDTDTLHVLVRDYRESRKILLNIEYRLMLQMAPDYENLTLLQKVEVFEYALDNTTGQDLYRVLWLKSVNSEAWLERRSTYTRSLAVNSMVGHILGLGDRHPSNLLLDRITGKVVHIDFGDCFEVAMHREKFPEKIPFRLTRMLTHAMEVSGIQGSFKNTCEITMSVLRENKESLMAVLEAFVYDPLINWRLLQATEGKDGDPTDSKAADATKIAKFAGGPTRKVKADENEIFNENAGDPVAKQEVRNERALMVYNRVQHKLTGRDFNPETALTVVNQVERLIQQATSLENLCQLFSGWCAFW